MLTLFRIGLFWAAQGWRDEGAKDPHFPKICYTYPTVIKLGTVTLCLKKIKKYIYINRVAHSLSSADISIFFIRNQLLLLYQEVQI